MRLVLKTGKGYVLVVLNLKTRPKTDVGSTEGVDARRATESGLEPVRHGDGDDEDDGGWRGKRARAVGWTTHREVR